MDNIPLAERMRPQTLKDVIGQQHLLGKTRIISEIIATRRPINLILWGPPGSGKTTLARIIANETGADFLELSAVTSGKADVMKVIGRAEQNRRLAMTTVVFVDEIHRFNKAQQDTFLPFMENGTLTLIGATTENPSFEIIQPLLSRSRVLVLELLSQSDIVSILSRAIDQEHMTAHPVSAKILSLIADMSGGDARVALGNLELTLQLAKGQKLTPEIVLTAAQHRPPGYDKKGDNHYHIISAFIKSMRGGDMNASYYYLARMISAGEDPKFIARRMVVFASEDIGLAAPAALNIAVSCFLAVERVGLPECQYNLFHCAAVLAKAPKSRQVADAMQKAMDAARQYSNLSVPYHLRNATTSLQKDLGYAQGTKWQAGFAHPKGFLPEEIDTISFFDNPSDNPA